MKTSNGNYSNVLIVGPGNKFRSGLTYFTSYLSDALGADTALFRDMLPAFLFPGKDRLGEPGENEYIDWYNPLTWIRALKQMKGKTVIFEWWTCSVLHMYLFFYLFHRGKKIIEIHETSDVIETGNSLLKIYGKFGVNILTRLSDNIVVHSKYDQQYFPAAIVIPHGLYNRYTRVPKRDDVFRVLFFGLIRDYKGLPYLIEAFKEANIPNSELLIAGESWDKVEITGRNIRHMDRYIDDSEIADIFSQSSVLVLPYLRASSSGVAHIAMGLGIKIISTDVGGLRESLTGYCGALVLPSINDLAWALEVISEIPPEIVYKQPEHLKWENLIIKWKQML